MPKSVLAAAAACRDSDRRVTRTFNLQSPNTTRCVGLCDCLYPAQIAVRRAELDDLPCQEMMQTVSADVELQVPSGFTSKVARGATSYYVSEGDSPLSLQATVLSSRVVLSSISRHRAGAGPQGALMWHLQEFPTVKRGNFNPGLKPFPVRARF